MKRSISRGVAVVLVMLGVSACGGGGGSASIPQDQSEFSYTGAMTPAHVTEQNANLLFANIFNGASGPASAAPTRQVTGVREPSFTKLPFSSLSDISQRAVNEKLSPSVLGVFMAAISGGVNYNDCTVSGRVGVRGELDQNGLGVLSLSFEQCDDGDGVVMNGPATFNVKATDPYYGVFTDVIIEFKSMTFTSSGTNITFNGTMRSQYVAGANQETLTINAVSRDNLNHKMLKWDNFNVVDIYNGTSYTETISGRVYDSVEGYVDVTTPSPLIYGSDTLGYPDGGGELLIVGDVGARARLTSLSGFKVRVEVDSHGDGVFESSKPYYWINLTGAPAANEIPPDEVLISATPVLAIEYGKSYSSQLHAEAGDGSSISYSLLYGPSGMQVDAVSGQVSWVVNLPMFGETQAVNYAVLASNGRNSAQLAVTVTVTDPGHAVPLVRTGIQIPSQANGIRIADFDGNGKPELAVSAQGVLYTLVFDGANYVQDWVYPFNLGSSSSTPITSYDTNRDGHPDMIVGGGSKITLIDGVSRKVIGEIADGFAVHYSIEVADIDGDGGLEIVYLGASTVWGEGLTINVYNATTLAREWQSYEHNFGMSLAVGNVDGDTALEVITANGYVYDGVTKSNQWLYGAGFGGLVDTGDLDNDGVEEIVGMTSWQAARAYSAVSKTQLWQVVPSFADMTALLVANIDGDPQAEVIIGNGQWGDVIAYDGLNQAEEWKINSQNHGVSSLAVGDVDGDDKLEFVWASGAASSGAGGSLVVAGLNPTIGVEWTNVNPKQLDGGFSGGRWLTLAPGQKRLVFACASTDSGYGGSRLVALNPLTGAMNVSAELGANWNHRVALDGADYDADGIDEVYLSTAQYYDAYSTVYDFNGGVSEWTSPVLSSSSIIAVKRGDLDGDGHDDLTQLTGDGYVYVYSPLTSTIFWKSPKIKGYVGRDLEIADLDGDGNAEIIALSDQVLVVYEKQGSGYVERKKLDLVSANSETRLTVGNVDQDSQMELVVSISGMSWTTDPSMISIYDGINFQVESKFSLVAGVTDIMTSPETGGQLLIGAFDDPNYPPMSGKIMGVEAMSGAVIWESPKILGVVQNNSLSTADVNGDGVKELIFGTSRAMYITQ